MDQRAASVQAYRWAVFLLVLGYWFYQFHQMLDPTKGFGWQFRYLTIWALTASLLSAVAVLRLSMGWTTRRPETLAGVAAVMNAIVVYLYWRLFFADPANVSDGAPIPWWQEYYLHALGPMLQWIDAFLILGVFRRPWPVVGSLLAVIVAYVGWSELVIQPANARPVGIVTSGLPYPFLNNMEFPARARFYASSGGLALIVVAVGRAVNRFGLRRWFGALFAPLPSLIAVARRDRQGPMSAPLGLCRLCGKKGGKAAAIVRMDQPHSKL